MTDTSGTTGAGKLWGGRFAGGPSPELEALSKQHPLRLAAGGLRPRRLAGARPRRCTAPVCSTDEERDGLLRGARRARPAGASRGAAAAGRPTRTSTARSRVRSSSWSVPTSAASCAPAAAATTRSPRCSRCSCATTPGSSPAGARPRRRDRRPGRAPPRRDHAGPHAPPARPAGAAQPPPDGPRLAAGPGRRRGSATGTPGSPPTRRTAPVRWPAPASASTPRPSPATSASPAAPPTRSTAPRRATSSPSSPSWPR